MSEKKLVKVPATVRETAILRMLEAKPDAGELSYSRFAAKLWKVERHLRARGYTLGYQFDEKGDHGPWDSDLFREFQSLWLAQHTKNKRVALEFGNTHRPHQTESAGLIERHKRRLRRNRRRRPSEYLIDRSLATVEEALESL